MQYPMFQVIDYRKYKQWLVCPKKYLNSEVGVKWSARLTKKTPEIDEKYKRNRYRKAYVKFHL